MYAKYIKKEIADLNGIGSTQACYKMELTPKSNDEFISQCAREGHWEESLVKGVLALVSEKLSLCMAEGFSVKIDGIGTFHAKLGVRDDMLQDAFEKGESSRNAKSIQVKGVSFKADPDLTRATDRKCMLVRGGVSRLQKSAMTLDQRIEKAREFLGQHKFMRVPDYVRLTGLSRTTATVELRKIANTPSSGIASVGSSSQKYYMLREKTD